MSIIFLSDSLFTASAIAIHTSLHPISSTFNASPYDFPVLLKLTWYTVLLFILKTTRVDLSSLPNLSSMSSLTFTGIMPWVLRSISCVAMEKGLIPFIWLPHLCDYPLCYVLFYIYSCICLFFSLIQIALFPWSFLLHLYAFPLIYSIFSSSTNNYLLNTDILYSTN